MRDDRQRLVDILDAIDRIDRHTRGGRAAFERDELIQVWVLRHLQLIGEAARRLSGVIRSQHPEIPWAAIVAFRNFLVHDYFDVNLDIVWRVVDQDLPLLRNQVEGALQEHGWGRPPTVSEPSGPYSPGWKSFTSAAEKVLSKNAELYRRLA